MSYKLGCDIGGTFTDFVAIDGDTGEIRTHKRLTTPHNPAQAIADGVEVLAQDWPDLLKGGLVVHGTTLVVNAVIERKGAKTALITTLGFRDVLEIGRERRFDQYDIHAHFPTPLVPRILRTEVEERTHISGRELRPLDEKAVRDIARRLQAEGVESIAICLLHSYSNPAHEERIAEIVREEVPGVTLSVSSEILPEVGEYERTATTAVNAYTQPIVQNYLGILDDRLRKLGLTGELLVTLSSGGLTSIDTARRFPVRVMESGPAAGAMSTAYYSRELGVDRAVSFDMGGTTAKISLIRDGVVATTNTLEVDRTYRFKKGSGIPVRIPMIDLIEIGAGGGSIARVTGVGTVQVGPTSAGADPGPACYAQGGTLAAVTDANLVLGYLDADYFLGGAMHLDRAKAEAAIKTNIADPLGISVLEAAYAIHSVVNENMASAAKVYLAEQGESPERCTLITLGGGGPVHGIDMMRRMGLRRAIIPPQPGVASAFGMLVAPIAFEASRAFRATMEAYDPRALVQIYARLEVEARERLPKFVPADKVDIHRSIDMRYVGQGECIKVVVASGDAGELRPERIKDAFNTAYARLYGRVDDDQMPEFVTVRLTASYAHQTKVGHSVNAKGRSPRSREAYCPLTRRLITFPVYRRDELAAGFMCEGPVIVEEPDSTTVLPVPGTLSVNERGCLMIELHGRTNTNGKA